MTKREVSAQGSTVVLKIRSGCTHVVVVRDSLGNLAYWPCSGSKLPKMTKLAASAKATVLEVVAL